MKRIFTVLAALILTASVFAQSPEKMSYQAVIRDASNSLVITHAVGMQISILQGSASGTVVYTETQTPTTNANGMVSIEIGGGTVVSGTFATIDWANGPYFIKTETDHTGGTSYTITGTTQLLSVPYAFHAKTAETFTGTITETDPTYTSSQAAIITTNDITNLGNLSGINTGDQDGSETKVTAGTNVTVTGAGTTASPYVINTTNNLTIGDSYQGGIIFWLDATGQHGLIAATADQSIEGQVFNVPYKTGTMGDGLYAGEMNTAIIVATQIADIQTGSFAAEVCADYSVTVGGVTYGDWYLPSKYELNLLYAQKTAVGGFASGYYWSSTESNNHSAWIQSFDDGIQTDPSLFDAHYVRAVRAF
jgi:hypothetical protein